MQDFIEAAWVKRSVKRIEAAIGDFNRSVQEKETCRVAWGFPNAKEMKIALRRSAKKRFQQGLLTYGNLDIELLLDKHTCDLGAYFEAAYVLPTTTRELYDVLECFQSNVRPLLVVSEAAEEILILGVGTMLTVDGLNWLAFAHALWDLAESHKLIAARFSSGEEVG